MAPWDSELAAALAISRTADRPTLAQAVLFAAGRTDYYDPPPEPAVRFLAALAEEFAQYLWDDDRSIDITGRADAVTRELIRDVNADDAPNILKTIAPHSRLPAGTIADLHRAARAAIQRELPTFVARILIHWCERGILVDMAGKHRPPTL